jgi:hypothetical protein
MFHDLVVVGHVVYMGDRVPNYNEERVNTVSESTTDLRLNGENISVPG